MSQIHAVPVRKIWTHLPSPFCLLRIPPDDPVCGREVDDNLSDEGIVRHRVGLRSTGSSPNSPKGAQFQLNLSTISAQSQPNLSSISAQSQLSLLNQLNQVISSVKYSAQLPDRTDRKPAGLALIVSDWLINTGCRITPCICLATFFTAPSKPACFASFIDARVMLVAIL